MRLIDADVMIEYLRKQLCDNCSEKAKEKWCDICDYTYLIDEMKKVPTVDAEPVRHGQWIGKPIAGYSTVRCTQCGDVFLENSGNWNYCPNCGAKMDEVKDVKYRMDKQRRIRL